MLAYKKINFDITGQDQLGPSFPGGTVMFYQGLVKLQHHLNR